MVFGKLFGNKNFAKKFKVAYEKDDLKKMISVLQKWDKKGSHDANYYLAIVLTEIKLEEPLDEIQARYNFAQTYQPEDFELHFWFDSTATDLILDLSTIKNDDEMSDNYAYEFVKRLRKIEVITDINKLQRIQMEMWEVLNSWEKKSPNDANFICAYIIMNLPKLNKERFDELLLKANTCKPLDESFYNELMDNVETFAKIKQFEVKKYDKFKKIDCNEFPVLFLELKEKLSKVSNDNYGPVIADINYLLSDWEKKCPNDANYSCAYFIVNIDTFNNVEKEQMVEKILSQEPINKQAYEILISEVKSIINYVNDYNEFITGKK